MIYRICRSDPLEIEDLTPGKYRGKYLVLFRSSQDKDRIGGGLFQGLEECIKGRRTEHVHLIHNIDLVFTAL